jgi:hypothetical protein
MLIEEIYTFQRDENKAKLAAMNEYIDIYCERLGPGLWAEPLNALSNLAFFIAVYCAFQLARGRNILGPQSCLLLLLLTSIGIGSSLFHTFATRWAGLADVLPILLFQIAFLIIYTRQVIRLGWEKTLLLLLVFAVLVRFFGEMPASILNGSLTYAPAFIFLTGFGLYHWWSKKKERYVLLLSSATFVLSLTLRSLDMAVCDMLPIGVHYFWHIFNALVLYCALRGLFMNVSRAF